jgi:hypothetical protein
MFLNWSKIHPRNQDADDNLHRIEPLVAAGKPRAVAKSPRARVAPPPELYEKFGVDKTFIGEQHYANNSR